MSDRIIYRSESLAEAAREMERLMDIVEEVAGGLDRVDTSAQWWSKLQVSTSRGRQDARGALRQLRSAANQTEDNVRQIRTGILRARTILDDADRNVSKIGDGLSQGRGHKSGGNTTQGRGASEDAPWWEKMNLSGILGWTGMFAGWIPDLSKAFDVGMATLAKGGSFADWWKALEPFQSNLYEGIASQSAMGAVKGALGDMGGKVKEMAGDMAGKNGSLKAVASWAGLLLSGASNYAGNLEEQRETGISDGRVWAETVTETTVGVGLDIGMNVIVGAAAGAIAAAAGVAAAPAVVVAVAASLAGMAVNEGFKFLNKDGKTLTEYVSDGILDWIGGRAWKANNSMPTWVRPVARV